MIDDIPPHVRLHEIYKTISEVQSLQLGHPPAGLAARVKTCLNRHADHPFVLVQLEEDLKVNNYSTATGRQTAIDALELAAEPHHRAADPFNELALDHLHDIVKAAARMSWLSCNPLDAVLRAATAVEHAAAAKTGHEDKFGAALWDQVFRPNTQPLHLARTVTAYFRNPAAHHTAQLTPNEALARLTNISNLAEEVDKLP